MQLRCLPALSQCPSLLFVLSHASWLHLEAVDDDDVCRTCRRCSCRLFGIASSKLRMRVSELSLHSRGRLQPQRQRVGMRIRAERIGTSNSHLPTFSFVSLDARSVLIVPLSARMSLCALLPIQHAIAHRYFSLCSFFLHVSHDDVDVSYLLNYIRELL